MPTLLSMYVGTPQEQKSLLRVGRVRTQLWTTAIYKTPVSGPIWLRPEGLEGNQPADAFRHGGPDKVALAYSAEHYPLWQAELGRPDFPHGAFGENFTVAGLDEDSVCVGDVWRVGNALTQVAQPRSPCWKLARRWEMRDLPARVQKTGRTGWYLRVLQAGQVQVGDALELVERPYPALTVAQTSGASAARPPDLALWRALAECAVLAPGWRGKFIRRLSEAGG